jgi:hypothetical protein
VKAGIPVLLLVLGLIYKNVDSLRSDFNNQIERTTIQYIAADDRLEARMNSMAKEILGGQRLARAETSKEIHEVQRNINLVIRTEGEDSGGIKNLLSFLLGRSENPDVEPPKDPS